MFLRHGEQQLVCRVPVACIRGRPAAARRSFLGLHQFRRSSTGAGRSPPKRGGISDLRARLLHAHKSLLRMETSHKRSITTPVSFMGFSCRRCNTRGFMQYCRDLFGNFLSSFFFSFPLLSSLDLSNDLFFLQNQKIPVNLCQLLWAIVFP